MKKSRKPIALLSLVFLGIVGVYAHQQTIDGLHGRLLAILGMTDTEYAKGYSDSAFKKIEIGQSPEEVIEILGKPFNYEKEQRKRASNGLWVYSRSPNSRDYLFRRVRFKDGKVSEVDGHYYVD
jgi:hypothetical protein